MMDSLLEVIIANNVTRLRETKGYSKRELARLADIDDKQIRRIEDPNTSSALMPLIKVSKVLGCSIDDLIREYQD